MQRLMSWLMPHWDVPVLVPKDQFHVVRDPPRREPCLFIDVPSAVVIEISEKTGGFSHGMNRIAQARRAGRVSGAEPPRAEVGRKSGGLQ